MTITAQTAKSGPYTGNGVTVVFAYDFLITAAADLVVTVLSTDGSTLTTKTLNVDYTVTGAGDPNGGNIEMTVAPASGELLTITRAVVISQEVDLQNRDVVVPEVLEDSLDKLTQIAQDHQEQLDRAVKVDLFEEADLEQLTLNINALAGIDTAISTVAGISSSVVAAAANEADIDAVGANIADVITAADNIVAIQNATTAASAAAASASAAATSEANSAASAASASSSQSAAATSETNAAASQTAAELAASAAAASELAAEAAEANAIAVFEQFGDQYLGPKASDPTLDNSGNPLTDGDIYFNTTDNVLKFYSGTAWVAPESIATTAAADAQAAQAAAETAETNAATSETNAANSASAASTSEVNSAASAASASTSETNSAASATLASAAETNAAASEAAAAASFDAFDDRYLGSKASDPTVDNDGDPLLAGALYYNTTSSQMRVYSGTAWDFAYLPASNYLASANNLSDVADAATSRTNLGLGTAATQDVGTSANNVVQLDGTGKLPAIDGSQLTGVVSIPSGLISLWSGTVATIPSGWALCDGLNGTPDLTGRFVVHADADASGTYNVGATGGANTVSLTSSELPQHSHSFSGSTSNNGNHNHNTNNTGGHNHNVSNAGSHSHNYYRASTFQNGQTNNTASNRYLSNTQHANQYIEAQVVNTGSGGNHNHNTGNSGSHSHNISNTGAHSHNFSGNTGNVGSGSAHENRPPYYALAYIMKL